MTRPSGRLAGWRGLKKIGALYLGRLLALALAFVAGAIAGSALAQPRTPTASAVFPAHAFDRARFSVVAGSGGVPLNVVEVGDPSLPAVILIHGFRQSYLSWIYQFGSDLPSRCHIVAFDLRGHGNSGAPWGPEAYDHGQPWGDDLDAVIKATKLSRPLVVGWSYGGNVAMDFARYHPDVPVAGYILVATTGGFLRAPAPPPNAPLRPTASPNLQLNVAAVEGSINFLFPKTVDARLREEFMAASMRVSPFVDRAIALRTGYDNLDLLGSLHAPLSFVFGGKDPIVNPVLAQTLTTRVPQAKVVVFPKAGHGLFVEDPATFNALLDADQCRRDENSNGAQPKSR